MKFHLTISVDTKDKKIKDECMEVVASYLNRRNLNFDVGYDPREIDTDRFAKA